MKNIRNILLLALASMNPSFGQEWSFGPRINFPKSLNSTLTTVEVTQITLSLGGANQSPPVQWGAFARYDNLRFFALGEATIGKFSQISYINTAGVGFSAGFTNRMVGLNVQAGAKVLPWLRLFGGLGYQHQNWDNNTWNRQADEYQKRLDDQKPPNFYETEYRDRIRINRLFGATGNAYRPNILTGQAGLGVDIGGLTVDLAYRQSLTPLLDGIPTATGTLLARQHFGSYVLTVGYRLFPLRSHLLALRQNKAYERVKRDIPSYRNEFHGSVGLLGEDIGSAFIYENRYTRYLKRRFGLMAGLNVMRLYEDFETGFLPKHYNAYQLVTGVRILPLYSRRHTIGFSAGPTLTYESGIRSSSGGSRTINGITYRTVNWRDYSRQEGVKINFQVMLDYHFAATDRLILGPWLRINGRDYGSFGVQTGYRF
ncbi:MAG: hypothetical protein LH609_10405 [Rudanella sp.]|nr:hypothetical protein [Rudanella sp.]